MPVLFLLFVVVPLLELAILIKVGSVVGVWPTIGMLVATAALGSWLARTQGARVLGAIRADLSVGRMPAAHLLDGLMILAGGLMLLAPGFLSDVLGILLLLPPSRAWFKYLVRRRLERMIATGDVRFFAVMR
ncbi:MAG: FxsA family protein [Gemmatimonadota bacterium]